jgi:hypothetical protein
LRHNYRYRCRDFISFFGWWAGANIPASVLFYLIVIALAALLLRNAPSCPHQAAAVSCEEIQKLSFKSQGFKI